MILTLQHIWELTEGGSIYQTENLVIQTERPESKESNTSDLLIYS